MTPQEFADELKKATERAKRGELTGEEMSDLQYRYSQITNSLEELLCDLEREYDKSQENGE